MSGAGSHRAQYTHSMIDVRTTIHKCPRAKPPQVLDDTGAVVLALVVNLTPPTPPVVTRNRALPFNHFVRMHLPES